MGYYTNHSLVVLKGDAELEIDEVKGLQEVLNEEIPEYAFDDGCKWYDHNEDMLRVSKRFPDLLFKLHGEGEESGDFWNTYYKDGKMQHCPVKITYEPFNPDELK